MFVAFYFIVEKNWEQQLAGPSAAADAFIKRLLDIWFC